MSMKPYIKELTFGNLVVPVREISVAEIRAWLKDLETRAKDQEIELYSVERDLFEDLPIGDLQMFTGLPVDAFDGLRPSEMRQVVEAVKEVNPDFFAMRGRMRTAADQLIGFLRNAGQGLNTPPAFSPSADTSTSGATP